jgi:hypothetical protein
MHATAGVPPQCPQPPGHRRSLPLRPRRRAGTDDLVGDAVQVEELGSARRRASDLDLVAPPLEERRRRKYSTWGEFETSIQTRTRRAYQSGSARQTNWATSCRQNHSLRRLRPCRTPTPTR